MPQLTKQELRRFETDGYAIVRHLLDDELHLEPIRRAMGQAVDTGVARAGTGERPV